MTPSTVGASHAGRRTSLPRCSSRFPGNVQMALDASDRPALYRAATHVRPRVQVPLVAWAVQVARFSRRSSG